MLQNLLRAVFFTCILFAFYSAQAQTPSYSAATVSIPAYSNTDSISSNTSQRSWENFTDLDYESGFFELNRKSPIDFDYNSAVKKHIDYYLTKRRDLLSKVLGLAKYYYPIFEETLDKYNLPLELKHLAVIESALNPTAQSKTGAIGLWQFKYNTAVMLDLKIDNYIDERQDPIKATDAACRYLDFLFNTFGDWQLAIAAYNGGPGGVRNAILRSGGKTDFWEILPYLSNETRNYVPGFLAMAYLLENYQEFGIVPETPKISYHQVDTVMIQQAVQFQKISEKLNIPVETIRFLNPSYKRNYIPIGDNPTPLVLPVNKIEPYITQMSAISEATFPAGEKTNVCKEAKVLHTYTVKKGDYLNKIALKYRCSIDDIMAWNNLTGFSVHTGQVLQLWIPESLSKQLSMETTTIQNSETKPELVEKTSNNLNTTTSKNPIVYTIQKGDSLYAIAGKFNGVTVDELKRINNMGNDYVLLPGNKIIIPQP